MLVGFGGTAIAGLPAAAAHLARTAAVAAPITRLPTPASGPHGPSGPRRTGRPVGGPGRPVGLVRGPPGGGRGSSGPLGGASAGGALGIAVAEPWEGLDGWAFLVGPR